MRLSIPFTVSSAGTYYFLAELTHAKGTLYIDDMQVERGRASSYNMAVNSGFEKSLDGWTVSSGTATAEKNSTIGDSTYLKITGSATGMRSVKQSVEVNKSTQSTFVLSGWAYAAQSLPERDGVSNSFNLDATVIYSDGTSRVYPGAFSRDVGGQWQYISVPIVPDRSKTTVSRIEIIIKYNNNCNNVYFDNISLSMDEVSSYKYDSNGKVVSVLTSETSEVTASYEAGDLKSMTIKAVGTVTNTIKIM